MAILSPVPSMQDLNITFHESTLIFPSQETEKKSIFLSNMDQILNYNIPTAHFFSKTPQNVVKMLKMALEKVLVPYDFMAGRLELNHKTGCLEINCNEAGAGFVVASSEFTLDEIRDFLAYPNLGFQQLAVQSLHHLGPEVDQPLCIFQITSFKCGGFAMGMSTNHLLFDGLAAKTFLENLASQAFDDKRPLKIIPCNDRRLLAARSPPRVTFPHHEFLQLDLPTGEGSKPPVFDCCKEELEFRIFKFDTTHINQLKNKAKTDTNNSKRVSSFGVVAAIMWQCKALSNNKDYYNKDTISTLLNAIDIKSRVNPPLPSSYCGNAVLPIGVSATLFELEKGPFSKLVEMISDGAKRMTDEYVKSAFDWLEIHRGVPHGDYIVSSWLRLGFDQVVYPWGKPIYSCPVINHRKDICWIFPNALDGGIGAMVALPPKEMLSFEAIFHTIFA